MILALLLASYPVFQQGPSRDGGLAWPVNCVNCSGGGGSSVVTVDGGAIGIVSMPPVTVDGGSIAVTNFPATFWPNLQWVSIDGGVSTFVTNFPGNLLTDGGVVNVGNFPAMWPNLQWVSVDGGVTAFVSNFPANLLTDGGVVNVGNFPSQYPGTVVVDGGYLTVIQGTSPWVTSGGASAAQWTVVDGGYVNVLNFPGNLLTDGGVVNVGNFPATFWPNLQWVSIDGGTTAAITNFPANLLTDGGVVNVGNFPAQQAQWTTVDGGYVHTIPEPPTTPWACGVTVSTPGNTLTCQAAPGAGSLYLTDYQIWGGQDGGATLTPGKAAIVWGTGTNCATLDGGIVPSISGAGTALQIPYSANGGTSTTADFTTPIVAPALTQLCCHCSTWCTCQMNGYTR